MGSPGALGNDPVRLRTSGAQEIQGAANIAAAFGAIQGGLPFAVALTLLAALVNAFGVADLGAVARPVAGAVGATAFLSTAALAGYVASRRTT